MRWLKFNLVGMAGAVLQLIVLWALISCGLHTLMATALAVEAAVLHNYFWHVRWTWADRSRADRTVRSLLRFHLGNGLVSIFSNVAWMWLLSAWPVVIANLVAITATSVVNFLLSDWWAFAAHGAHGRIHGLLQRLPGDSADERTYHGPQ